MPTSQRIKNLGARERWKNRLMQTASIRMAAVNANIVPGSNIGMPGISIGSASTEKVESNSPAKKTSGLRLRRGMTTFMVNIHIHSAVQCNAKFAVGHGDSRDVHEAAEAARKT